MTFQSAPHSVLPIMLGTFKAFFLMYFGWGSKDSLPSDTPSPRNNVFFTTEVWLLSRNSRGAKRRPLFWQICIQTVFVLEGARCSSVVRAFAHGAMGRRIDPSWSGPI